MSTDELRTAAIEAAVDAASECLSRAWVGAYTDQFLVAIVDAVLPLLVTGTASRIADAIEAEANRKPQGIREHLARDSFLTSREWLSYAASIARRVGETS